MANIIDVDVLTVQSSRAAALAVTEAKKCSDKAATALGRAKAEQTKAMAYLVHGALTVSLALETPAIMAGSANAVKGIARDYKAAILPVIATLYATEGSQAKAASNVMVHARHLVSIGKHDATVDVVAVYLDECGLQTPSQIAGKAPKKADATDNATGSAGRTVKAVESVVITSTLPVLNMCREVFASVRVETFRTEGERNRYRAAVTAVNDLLMRLEAAEKAGKTEQVA